MTGKIVVVGSSNTDMIPRMDHIPRPGETVLGGRFSMAPGGKGANQAVALSPQQPLRQAVRFASAAAACSVTTLGAQPSAPEKHDIERRLGD